MSRGRLYITLAALHCMDSEELNSFLFVQKLQISNAYVTEGKMTLKYTSKSEFQLGKKRLRLIRLSSLTNPLLSSDMCFVHVSLLSMVTPNSLELVDHFMRCWLIFKLPKGPIKWFRLRIIPSHFLGCGTRELCLHQRASSSRALFSVVVTCWSTDSPTQYMVVSLAYRNVIAVLSAFVHCTMFRTCNPYSLSLGSPGGVLPCMSDISMCRCEGYSLPRRRS